MSHGQGVRIALTPGEPAGIGLDILVQLAQQIQLSDVLVFADKNALVERAKQLGLSIDCIDDCFPYRFSADSLHWKPGQIRVRSMPLARPSQAGKLDVANAQSLLDALFQATTACLENECQALVTGPLHKGIINQAGIHFTGHTEFLALQTQTPHVVMMLATPSLRVALATTHRPLSEVPAAITKTSLRETIRILDRDLRKRFDIASPRIIVCGLNPHAGEGGYLGREELDIISPVIEESKQNGMNVKGPFAADTIFTPSFLNKADVVLAMYHDQGLPVLKYSGFSQAVNVTLGLPIIRTSVDHGTALPLAGTGKASCESLLAAINMARAMSVSAMSH